jgi:PAS domain S-box-containing protein
MPLREISASEGYFQALVQGLPHLVWSGALRGAARFANRRCHAFASQDDSEGCAFVWYERVHPEDRGRLDIQLRAAEASGDGFATECRLCARDGHPSWFRVSAGPLPVQGTTREWAFTAVEIEDLDHLRERYHADRERLNGLLRSSPGVVLSYRMRADGSTQMLFVSQAAQQVYGLAPEAVIADPSLLISRLEPNNLAGAAAAIAASLASGQPWHTEFRYRHPSEGETWLDAHFVPGHDAEGPLWNGIVLDITKRKRSEEQLALSQEMLETALGATQMGAWVWDPAVNKLWASDSQRALWEITDDVPQWYDAGLLRDHVHADDVPRVDELMARAAATGERMEFEFRLRTSAGGLRWIAARARTARDPQGNVLRVFGTNLDITQQKLTAENVTRSQKLEALGTLAGGIAHDFNNVLFAISGNASLAIDRLPSDHELQGQLREIVSASDRASELVAQILAFSRPQDQKLKLLEPAGPVRDAVNLARATISARIAIECRCDQDTPAVLADASRLVQVVINLCTNASHAIGKESAGLIEVQLGRLKVGREGISNERVPPGDYALLSVSDNGCGMDDATQTRIFDPFFTTKAPGEGSGLGLSVVHGIVRALNGIITVYSQPGKGSTFRLYLPASAGSVPSVAPKHELSRQRGSGQRVLYVDDEEMLVQLGRNLLEALGYTPSVFRSAEEALTAFRREPKAFSAAITDLSMPGLSGFDLARALLELRRDLPILVMSGYVGPYERELARQVGVQHVALKPVGLHDLADLLARMC